MKRYQTIFAALCLCSLGAQSVFAQTPSPTPSAPVYDFGSEVTPPQIIPFGGNPPAVSTCKQKLDGNVVLSLEIDSAGRPQKVMFVKPHSDGLDLLAIKVTTADRFNPGTINGAPASVKAALEMHFQTCLEALTDPAGAAQQVLRMRAWPEQILGKPADLKLPVMSHNGAAPVNKGVSAPIPINEITPPHLPRGERFTGKIQVSITVDEHGLPQSPHIVKGASKDVDYVAVIDVMSYRFTPAMEDEKPVPVTITIFVNFT